MIAHIDTACTFLLFFIMCSFKYWKMNRHGSHKSYSFLKARKSNAFLELIHKQLP